MTNTPTVIDNTTTVQVVPFEDGWTVQWGAGHYAFPLAKEKAITKASKIAIAFGHSQIAILTAGGVLEELMPLASC